MNTDTDTHVVLDLGELTEQMLDSAWMTVTDPRSGQPSAMRILVSSPHSRHYRSLNRRIANRNIAEARKSKGGELSAERIEANGLDLISGATLGWENAAWKGAALEFSESNARMLYENVPDIYDQVNAWLGDRAHFFAV